MSSFAYGFAGAVLVISLLIMRSLLFSRRKPFLPGPRSLPLLGNIHNAPSIKELIFYRNLGQRYDSDIYQFTVFGETVVVLNSIEAATDLLVRRSHIYSDRPDFTMANDVINLVWNVGLQRYDDSWKERCSDERSKELKIRRNNMYTLRKDLIRRILGNPAHYVQEFRLYAGKTILQVTYGIEIREHDDRYIVIAEEGMKAVSLTVIHGGFWVDRLPILRYIPSWMPGASFKRYGNTAKKAADAMHDAPMHFAKQALLERTAKPCLASYFLSDMEEDGMNSEEDLLVLKNVLATSYAAGSDTVVSALSTFVLAMVQHPHFFDRGQNAVDARTGQDGLPSLNDRHSIPYVEALLKEVLRWRPVLPLGVSHRVMQDDMYRGYHIPKDATVIGNAWAILHDKGVYGSDADEFNPERFLSADGTLNTTMPHPTAAFGFGRRICPGQDIAEDTIWSAIASILAVFNVAKLVDGEGKIVEPSGEYTSIGAIRHPLPFQCSITPRSHTKELIKEL